ncbi:MAG: transposase mutator type [Pseudonocardiales bacterium]|nr:transposase mutator type [Pseudonocardiales bacterium]
MWLCWVVAGAIHLIRNTFRLTSRKYWAELKRDLRPIDTAVNPAAARSALDDLPDEWGTGGRSRPAPNAFAITFADRFPAAETY